MKTFTHIFPYYVIGIINFYLLEIIPKEFKKYFLKKSMIMK